MELDEGVHGVELPDHRDVNHWGQGPVLESPSVFP